MVNYLDDYFFAALLSAMCNLQLNTFLQVCEEIKFPVALEKTFWADSLMTFLGMLLDSERQIVCVPVDKIAKATNLIHKLLSKKKVIMHDMQQICGYLNFLFRCVVPGRVF